MDNDKFIKSYLENSELRLKFCLQALSENKYDVLIRECQEIVELCSKALLYSQNMVVPKIHNMAQEIDDIKELFSDEFSKKMPEYYILLRTLYNKRELAMYGDEDLGIPSNELFTKEDAEKYLTGTKDYFEQCKKELKNSL